MRDYIDTAIENLLSCIDLSLDNFTIQKRLAMREGMLSTMKKSFDNGERAVLAKASQQVQGDAREACESYIESLGGADSYAWQDAQADVVFIAGFEAGRKSMPAPKQEPVGTNRYGLDMSYMVGKLNILIRDIDCYKPDEAARTLARLSLVADENVFSEPEFSERIRAKMWIDLKEKHKSAPPQAAAIPEGWQLVPIEPTPEMLNAAAEKLYGFPREKAKEWAKEEKYDDFVSYAEITYRSIILAAPKPEGEQ